MHESGLIRRLVETALAEAARHGGRLRAIDVRLGALAGGSPDHLREHFQIEIEALGLEPIALNVQHDPDHPGGVEVVGVDLAR